MKKFDLFLLSVFFFPAIFSCCRKEKIEHLLANDETVARVGDSILYRSEVISRIPLGLTQADSAALFDVIVDNWVENNLLIDYAANNTDKLAEIEAMVDRYRKQLIIEAYKKSVRKEYSDIPADSIKKYYDSHREFYILERPIVKGIFIKIPENSVDKDMIVSLMSQGNKKSAEKIDDLMKDKLSQYTNFIDNWIDWNVVEDLFPVKFDDPNKILASKKLITAVHNGMTYLLGVSEYKQAGQEMPFEFASVLIAESLKSKFSERSEQRVINAIRDKALNEGRLQIKKKY